MNARRRGRGDRGSVAIELPLAVGLLLIPAASLLLALPRWPEAQSVATTAAKEAATLYATADGPSAGEAAARSAVAQTAANFGRPLQVSFTGAWCRGCVVTARVTVDVPAFVAPGMGTIAATSWTASSSAHIDEFRSVGGGT